MRRLPRARPWRADRRRYATLRKWAQMLSGIGYDGGLSLECSHSDDYEGDLRTAAETLSMFREV